MSLFGVYPRSLARVVCSCVHDLLPEGALDGDRFRPEHPVDLALASPLQRESIGRLGCRFFKIFIPSLFSQFVSLDVTALASSF
jgi:hypothetical protein